MSTSRFALLVGLALAAIAVVGGFGAFLLAAVFAAVGWGVGLVLEGKVDVQNVLSRATDRR